MNDAPEGSLAVWIIQPVSPRLDLAAVASRLGCICAGAMPPSRVDVRGRLLVALVPTAFEVDDAAMAEALDESRWVAGWRKEHWIDGRPIGVPDDFRALPIATLDANAYLHSSELPEWPAAP